MTEKSEWQFLVDYVKDDTTDFLQRCLPATSLWPCGPAYCLHNEPAMSIRAMYDATLFDLWLAVSLERRRALQIFRFSEFDSWMSQWLV